MNEEVKEYEGADVSINRVIWAKTQKDLAQLKNENDDLKIALDKQKSKYIIALDLLKSLIKFMED